MAETKQDLQFLFSFCCC